VRNHTANPAGDPGKRKVDRGHDERLIKEALEESNWTHETCKSAMSGLIKKGVLIVALFFLGGFLGGFALNSLVPMVVFLIGTTIIVIWDWSYPKKPESD